jgi:hypothetical protein
MEVDDSSDPIDIPEPTPGYYPVPGTSGYRKPKAEVDRNISQQAKDSEIDQKAKEKRLAKDKLGYFPDKKNYSA